MNACFALLKDTVINIAKNRELMNMDGAVEMVFSINVTPNVHLNLKIAAIIHMVIHSFNIWNVPIIILNAVEFKISKSPQQKDQH